MPGRAGHSRFFGGTFDGDINLVAGLAHYLADKLLAVAIAIRQRRIDEVQPSSMASRRACERLAVIASLPQFSADAPCPVTDLAHLKSGSAQFAIAHDTTIIET